MKADKRTLIENAVINLQFEFYPCGARYQINGGAVEILVSKCYDDEIKTCSLAIDMNRVNEENFESLVNEIRRSIRQKMRELNGKKI